MINAETICHQDLSCIISHLPHVAKIIIKQNLHLIYTEMVSHHEFSCTISHLSHAV